MPELPSAVVIIGAGQAGYQTAASLRQYGFAGSITLVSDESELPYQRPPLSKAYLLGELDARRLLHRQQKWYADQGVALVHDAAVAIDRERCIVETASGRRLPYDHLVLATGARNRPLAVPGAELRGVTGMRRKADADALSAWLHEGARVVVVGAGFIGLEFASVAAARGASVHVIELAERPMARAVSAPTAAFFRRAHEQRGVRFDFGQGLTRIDGTGGRVRGVTTADGRALAADVVVYGIGIVPNTELAERAGLALDNGIRVDSRLLSSDPRISAIGDATSFPCAQLHGAVTRLESVQNAAEQARHVAARLMGRAADYSALPWFWSEQGEFTLQIAGLAQGCRELVDVSGVGPDEKLVLSFSAGVLSAVETVNRPADHMAARRLLAGTPALTIAEARAEGFALAGWERNHALTTAR